MSEEKKTKKKITSNWIMTYEIYGLRYKFEKVYIGNDGIPYGYCYKSHFWAWLYDNAVSRYGKDIDLVPAIRLDSKIHYSDGRVVAADIVRDSEE